MSRADVLCTMHVVEPLFSLIIVICGIGQHSEHESSGYDGIPRRYRRVRGESDGKPADGWGPLEGWDGQERYMQMMMIEPMCINEHPHVLLQLRSEGGSEDDGDHLYAQVVSGRCASTLTIEMRVSTGDRRSTASGQITEFI